MKKLAVAVLVAALVGYAGAALAADAAVKAPVMKGPSAPPPPMISGYIGLYGGLMKYRSGSYWDNANDTVPVWGGEARVNVMVTPTTSVQIDVETEATSAIHYYGGHRDTDPRLHGIVGVHLTHHSGPSALGVLLGMSANNNMDYSGAMSHYIAALEWLYFMNNYTLYLQGGWIDLHSASDSGYYSPENLWFLRYVGRYFVDPNTKLEAELAYAKGGQHDDNEKIGIWAWALRAEKKQANSPWAFFARYEGNKGYEHGAKSQSKTSEHMGVVGIKAYFGHGTLVSNEQSGANRDMPTSIIRTFPYAYLWDYN